MSRDSAYAVLDFAIPAAAAATVLRYYALPARYLFEGWGFMYDATEGGTDNTVTIAIAYTIDGTNFTTLKAVNSNTAGLLDSAAPLVVVRNPSNPGSAGATWGAESSPTNVALPEKAVIRVSFVTAGTSPVAMRVFVYGKYLAPVE